MSAQKVMRRIMIVRSTGMPQENITQLESLFKSQAELVVPDDKKESIFGKIAGIHALIGCPRPLFSTEIVAKAGKELTWIHVPGAGCEEFLIPKVVDSNITLTNGKIIQGPSVSDHAVALLLCLSRNLNYVLRESTAKMPRPTELRGKTALVIGCGGIGRSEEHTSELQS